MMGLAMAPEKAVASVQSAEIDGDASSVSLTMLEDASSSRGRVESRLNLLRSDSSIDSIERVRFLNHRSVRQRRQRIDVVVFD